MVEPNGLQENHHPDYLVTLNGGSHSGSSGRSTPSGQNGGSGDPAPGKLFVGGLSWQTSSDKLKEYFGISRGFGFITFSEPSSVDKVLKVPIHTLDGKKIDPKHATPKNRPKQPSKTKKIFVGGVSQDTSADEVKAYFNQFGKVEETVMLMDQQTKRHRGFGFVTFENEDVVDRVCEIHFHTIKNKKVECKKAQPKEAVQASAQLMGKRLMLSGLGVRLPAPVAAVNPLASVQPLSHVQAAAAAAAAVAAQAQNAAVASYGKLIYPQLAAYSRGFGFITFSEPSSVDKVLKVPIHTLDGKKIDPKHATPKNRPKQPSKTKKIFVGGVSQDTSADEVKAYFNQFGKVEETVMLMDQQTKRHRGFGFVTFENEDVVDRVCEIHFHTIKNKKVECKKAQPKEAVQASAQLMGKRLMLSGLGVRLPAPVAAVNPLASVQPLSHVQAAAAAAAAVAAQAQNAAVASYGKLIYPQLAAYRYSPYTIPGMSAVHSAAAAAAVASSANASGVAPGPADGGPGAAGMATQMPPSHFQGYNLTNIDIASLQGIDWGAMYGMGMYV
ncbi:hypothetical protein HUJ04_011356 [Dendroctonus ponderosae]|nr:hypothetical protein HUJ04_011356 [Dendroctonus ponderosae]KAH1021872.1 hypothetical protein HUJ04_011356 [Dendroctonus ponderosae]